MCTYAIGKTSSSSLQPQDSEPLLISETTPSLQEHYFQGDRASLGTTILHASTSQSTIEQNFGMETPDELSLHTKRAKLARDLNLGSSLNSDLIERQCHKGNRCRSSSMLVDGNGWHAVTNSDSTLEHQTKWYCPTC